MDGFRVKDKIKDTETDLMERICPVPQFTMDNTCGPHSPRRISWFLFEVFFLCKTSAKVLPLTKGRVGEEKANYFWKGA